MCRVIGAKSRINKPSAPVEIKDYDVATRSRNPGHFNNRRRRIFQIEEDSLCPTHVE